VSCHVLVRGGKNSALVEFEDGTRHVVNRNALRKDTVTLPSIPDVVLRCPLWQACAHWRLQACCG
jgi:hypothetical protein